MALKIEIKGIERIRTLGSKVQTALKASASLAPIRAEASRIVADSNRRSFAGERAPDGQSWKPRKQQRGRKIVNRKLLVDTGRFQEDLTNPRTRIDNFGVRLGIEYNGGRTGELLKFHNFGTKNMAARPVGLGLDKQAQEEINKIAVAKIRESFSKALKEIK